MNGSALGLASIAGCAGDENDTTPSDGEDTDVDPETLRLSSAISEEDVEHREGGAVFVENAESMSDGSLDFDVHISGELGASDDAVDLVRNEVADIAWAVQGWHADQIPLSGVMSVPGEWEQAATASVAAHEIVSPASDGILQEVEYDELGLQGLFVSISQPYQLFFRDERIETLDDLQGLSIRSVGGLQSVTIEKLGADPVEIAAADIFPAFERGTVDAVAFDPALAEAYDVPEVANYMTTNINLGAGYGVWLMNQDVYQSLHESQQQAIDEASAETAVSVGEAMDREADELRESYDEDGVLETYEVDDPEAWTAALDGVEEEWIDRQESPDDAADVIDAWNEALDAAMDS